MSPSSIWLNCPMTFGRHGSHASGSSLLFYLLFGSTRLDLACICLCVLIGCPHRVLSQTAANSGVTDPRVSPTSGDFLATTSTSPSSSADHPVTQAQGSGSLLGPTDVVLRQPGDLLLGALFALHYMPEWKGAPTCGNIWEQYGIHRVEAFKQAVKDVNDKELKAVNITLGFAIRDSCYYTPVAMEQCKHFIIPSLLKSYQPDMTGDSCMLPSSVQPVTSSASASALKDAISSPPLIAVVGPGSSGVSAQVQEMLQLFRIPQVGYSATAISLSDTTRYRYFVRVVPSDSNQAQALADFVAANGWTYVSALHSGGK